jgi:hypothetical protein
MEFEPTKDDRGFSKTCDRSGNQRVENMKLSIEAKVAAAVAASFIALTAAAIGQAASDAQTGRANKYGEPESFRVEIGPRNEIYRSSLPGDTDAHGDSGPFSAERVAGTTAKKQNEERNRKN